MRYVEYPPSAVLADWVKCYWVLEDLSANGPGQPDRIVPDGCPEVILHYGDPFVENDGSRKLTQPRALFAGQLTRPLILQSTGHIGMVAVRFLPGGTVPFLDVPMDQTVDRRVALEDMLNHTGRLFHERICLAGSDTERVRLLENFLIERMRMAKQDVGSERIAACVRAISSHHGHLSLDRLAKFAGLSHRQLERRFRHAVGVPPRLLASIVRFRRVFDCLNDGTSWSAIAIRSGYYDQAHLIRDFKRFAALPPTTYLDSESPFSRQLTHRLDGEWPNVGNVQATRP